MSIAISDIKNATKRISSYIQETPIFTSSTLDSITTAQLFFKCENFQKTGSFKFRGACNAVFSLSDKEAARGVATHSSGNHAQALSLAAKKRGIPAYIVMPTNSSRVKRNAVLNYGAQITYCEPNIDSRMETLNKIIAETKASFIHPYNNETIIAGAGTAALEFQEQVKDLDYLIVPVGGGGLISGSALVYNALAPQTKIIGAEPEIANDAYLSFRAKKIIKKSDQNSICDGLLVPLGDITAPIIFKHVSDIITASERTIIEATQYIFERMKLVVEPSGAITLAVILENPEYFADKKIGLLLSGGNVDVKTLSTLF